ncbi:MAG: metal ABC transporter substrate-binding protein [Anaerolineae bacterium]
MNRVLTTIVLVFTLMSVGVVSGQDSHLRVVATTTILADVAQQVGGELVDVTTLVPANSDVHAFEPTPQVVQQIADADVVLVVGIGLESFMGDLVDNAASVQPKVVSNGIEMLAFGEHGSDGENAMGMLGDEGVCEDAHHDEAEAHEEEHEHGSCDPHVWTDPTNVMVWANNIAEIYGAVDTAHADVYRANAEQYIETLKALDAEVTDILTVIPDGRRKLVTNHEFFGYFAHHYGFEIVGVVVEGGTTLAEADPQQLTALAQTIKEAQVPAIFIEFSANPQLAQAVADETGVSVITSIYSDSLSEADGPASTYADYMRYNARAIAEGLK